MTRLAGLGLQIIHGARVGLGSSPCRLGSSASIEISLVLALVRVVKLLVLELSLLPLLLLLLLLLGSTHFGLSLPISASACC